jgi:glucuronide carrier protein
VGGALAAYALALGGYKSGAAQTADAVFGIQLAAGAIPAVLTVLAVLVMSRYKLTDAMHAEILTEIRARRSSGEAGDHATVGNAAGGSTASLTASSAVTSN